MSVAEVMAARDDTASRCLDRLRAGFGHLVLATLLALAPVAALAADVQGAAVAVNRIYGQTLANADMPEKLAEMVGKVVDLDGLSAQVLGPAWDGASQVDRADFEAALRDVIAVELARRLHPDLTFAITAIKPLRDDDVVVLSTLTRADGRVTRLDWKMRPCGDSWCIFDLIGDGASFSVARRNAYALRLDALNGSVPALVRSIRAEIGAKL
ncbi:ABC transporter substrate-binding protein [Limimaricola sp.]|uniref:Tgt2/MlaC family protein n=1 Tax=Limimaricola sp. TaxID=2211665 RepID=UPI0025BEC30C|nr:ABC transporter substrate-binding protein [Limimaricola sp.]